VALSVWFDHAQQRVDVDRVSVSASGKDLNNLPNDDVWVDPITETLMIRPSFLKAGWYTSNSGDYAKLGMSAFGLSSTDWEERSGQHSAGPWIARKDSETNGTAITSSSYAKNRGFSISWFSYGSGDVFLQLRCGWHTSATISGGVGLEVYSDGAVLVYKGGVLVDSGKISGANSATTKTNQVMEIMLLPFRHRELLVFGNEDGFSVLFEDIDEDDADPTITPAAKWWFEIVDGGTQVQTAPLVFSTSTKYAYSQKLSFLEPPFTGETAESFTNDSTWLTTPAAYKIYGHPGFGSGTQTASSSLVQWDLTAFTPNGGRDQVRVKTALTSSNSGYSPFIYGASMGYAGTYADTDDSEIYDATSETTQISLTVPDSADGVRAEIEVRDPAALEAHINGIVSVCSRPIELKLGSVQILDGIGSSPHYNDDYNPLTERLTIEVCDLWRAMELYIFREPIPLDGVLLTDALKFMGRMAGITNYSVTTSTFEIPFQPSGKSGEWGTMIEPGDSAGDWFHRLIETYAGNWVYGVRPTLSSAELFALSPTDIGTTAAKTLYRTSADAVTAGFTGTDTHRNVYNALQIAVLEPVANDISVTGVNPRTGRPMRSHKADAASKDPTTAPSSRPENWLGFARPYGLVDPGITTQSACDFACNLIYDRLTPITEIVEWESTLLVDEDGVPLWRGANVRLVGWGTYRIRSFEFSAVIEIDSDTYFRPVRYCGEKVAAEP
jgi:hypothetical protein